MKKFFTVANILYLLLFCGIANSYVWISRFPVSLFLIVPLFLFINLFAGAIHLKTASRRLKICRHGGVLLCVFAISLIVSIAYHIVLAFVAFPAEPWLFVWSAVLCICAEAILFWNGIICVYCTSVQLGINTRVIGVVCGMIPIANLIVLKNIINIVMDEVDFEIGKEKINRERKEQKICHTEYPILLVHGVFFRDSKYLNYWGRIPGELEANGAEIYYGEHPSALSVEESACELALRIKQIVKETGCEKLNIIAHSKGGLDCRYVLSGTDAAPFVASLTTVNTPHRGCLFADYLLQRIPVTVKKRVADTYNAALKKMGDRNPDFLAAVNDLTAEACAKFDSDLVAPEGIYCQSVGSRLNRATNGKFPLNFSYHLVKAFDGANDGLVGEDSFAWGERCQLVTVSGRRGVSHGDMIDLNRENIKDFDVREFYVDLVDDLRKRGL